jgi:hypothetical protein
MTYDYTDFDAWVTFCKEMGLGDKIVLYSIAPWHNTITYWENGVLKSEGNTIGNIVPDAMWTHFLTDLIQHLEEKGWFDDAYIGIDERGFSAAAFDLIESIKGSNGEPLKTAGAMDNFVNKWNLALRVTDLNVGDTAAAAHPADFARLLDTVQPQAIVIKPSLHGGLLAAQHWAEGAEARNIRWWVNSALESHVGLTVLAEWCAYAAPGRLQGLGTGRLFTDDAPGCVQLVGNCLRYQPIYH